MIGDQPDRDVRLAHGAGLKSILVMGNFRPEWLVEKDSEGADAIVADFSAAIRWIVDHSTQPAGAIVNRG